MRQFKFRAWEMNKMYYQVRCGGVFDDIPTAPTVWNDEHGDWLNMTGQPHTVIMQWTGLKDKNGREIYEGDIVKGYIGANNQEYMGVCEYSLKIAGFKFGNKKTNSYSKSTVTTARLNNKEIIGNVYENPELIAK